jgi:hypothetical protein
LLDRLSELANVESIVAALKPLLRQPAVVSRGRRAALVAACVAFPLVAGVGFIFAARIWDQWQRSQPEITALSEILQQRAMQRMPWIGKKIPGPGDQTLARYIAGHYRAAVTNTASWESFYALAVIDHADRQFVEESVKANPSLTEEELREVAAAMQPFLPKQPRLNPLRLAWLPLMAGGMSLIFYVALPALVAALLFRGGLLLRVFGIAVVRRDGSRASRLRVLWRGLIAWSPVLLAPGLMGLFSLVVGESWGAALWTLVALGLTVWSITMPGRSLQDRLAGTCLVPR